MTHNHTPHNPLFFVARLLAAIALAICGGFATSAAADDWRAFTHTATVSQTANIRIISIRDGVLLWAQQNYQTIVRGIKDGTTLHLWARTDGLRPNENSAAHLYLDESTSPQFTITTTITAAIPPEEQIVIATMSANTTNTITASNAPTARTLTNTFATATAVYHLRRIDQRGVWRANWKAHHDYNQNPLSIVIAHSKLIRDCQRGNANCSFTPVRMTLDKLIDEKERANEELQLGYALIKSLGRGKLPDDRGQIGKAVSDIVGAVYYQKCSASNPDLPCLRKTNSTYNNNTIRDIINALGEKDYDGVIPADWGNALLKEWRDR